MRGARQALAGAVLCGIAALAHGHDSWLSPARHDAPAGEAGLELATGTRYPLAEFGQSAGSVARAECAAADGAALALAPAKEQPQWLELAINAAGAQRAAACWLELRETEIEIEPRLVQVYLAEIQASAANREAWASLQARKLPWRERYRKFARIEMPSLQPRSPAEWAAVRKPVGLGLEIVVLGDQALAVGQAQAFQVLRDGKPLAGLPVELVSERSPLGVWRRTDAKGTLRHSLPFAGRWLLRGVDLRQSQADPQAWESRFVTLAIEVS